MEHIIKTISIASWRCSRNVTEFDVTNTSDVGGVASRLSGQRRLVKQRKVASVKGKAIPSKKISSAASSIRASAF